MKEQAVPPTGPAGPGGSTAQRRRQDDWRSRRNVSRLNAPLTTGTFVEQY